MLPKKKLIVLIIPFLLFIGSLTAQLILRSHITSKIEPVTFPSTLDDSNPLNPIVEITSGDLFYPRDYNPANTYPIVIIVHGFQVTKTTDLRLATELAKRNIFALPIDLSGHGHTSGRLGPYFWKHAIGAQDYIYSRPDLFNLSTQKPLAHPDFHGIHNPRYHGNFYMVIKCGFSGNDCHARGIRCCNFFRNFYLCKISIS